MKVSILTLLAVTLALAEGAAQPPRFRGGRFMRANSFRTEMSYDGAFTFCRIAFRQNPIGDGGGWMVDYPRADVNLSFRLSELTSINVSRDPATEFQHVVLRLNDPQLSKCQFAMMTEPGALYMDEQEAAGLRDYLLRGGFLWADDFWADYAFQVFENGMRKALPSATYPIVDLPIDHPLFHTLYDVKHFPQIPSIGYWFSGRTSERGAASATPHARAIFDEKGRLMVFISHNTDFGDAFEREGENRDYFDHFAADGYAVGINVILYELTH